MSSGRGTSATAEARVSPAVQSSSPPARLLLQKDNITIRAAKLSDAPELAVLMCELGYEAKRTEMETRLRLILSNPAYKTLSLLWTAAFSG
jgi:hypothetical protein